MYNKMVQRISDANYKLGTVFCDTSNSSLPIFKQIGFVHCMLLIPLTGFVCEQSSLCTYNHIERCKEANYETFLHYGMLAKSTMIIYIVNSMRSCTAVLSDIPIN